jgi:hypothetical protein
MIRIELDDFTIDVPIERRMTVAQFLAVADDPIAEWSHEPTYGAPIGDGATTPVATHPDEFQFEHEQAGRTEHILERVSRKLEGLDSMLARLERLEQRLEPRRY